MAPLCAAATSELPLAAACCTSCWPSVAVSAASLAALFTSSALSALAAATSSLVSSGVSCLLQAPSANVQNRASRAGVNLFMATPGEMIGEMIGLDDCCWELRRLHVLFIDPSVCGPIV